MNGTIQSTDSIARHPSVKKYCVTDSHLHENKIHGNPLFSFATYRMINATGALLVTSHWHKEIEILCFQEGHATVLISGREYLCGPHDIIFVNQGELHQIASDSPELLYHAFVFRLDSLAFSSQDYVQSHYLTPLCSKELFLPHLISHEAACAGRIFDELLEVIRLEESKSPGFQLLIKACLLKVFGILIEHGQLHTAAETGIRIYSDREKRLKEILTYIQDHYEDKMYLEDIARTFHMSGKYFSRYFKQHFGYSFVEYLNHFRVEKACALLVTTNMQIMEISLETGFDNFSYFIKKFKELTGFTPAAYRAHVTGAVPPLHIENTHGTE